MEIASPLRGTTENHEREVVTDFSIVFLDKICRTCLEKRSDLLYLFNENIDTMLAECTAVQVEAGDGLPFQICPPCRDEINKAFRFREKTKTSDQILRKYINTQSTHRDNITDNDVDYQCDHSDLDNTEIKIEEEETSQICNDHKCEKILSKNETEQRFPSTSNQLEPKISVTNNEETSTFAIKAKESPVAKRLQDKKENKNKVYTKPEKPNCVKSNTNGRQRIDESKRVCNFCHKSFSLKISLATHLRSHGFGEKKHACEHCDRKFYEANDLRIHIRKHTGERPLICQICGKTYADPRSLLKHSKIHTGEKNHECEICHKKFLHSYTLTAHRRTHTGEKPYVCSICGHTYATSTQLTIHVRSHTKEKPYKCNQCTKSFTSRSGLTAHELTHSGERKHICSVCGKGARTSSDLLAHMRTHTGEKPYECKMGGCTKRYKTSSQLASHTRSHTGEKRHVCDKCGRAFADTTQLKSHLNIHTGEKPFVCEECGSRFTHSGSLYSHMKSHKKRKEKEAALQQIV